MSSRLYPWSWAVCILLVLAVSLSSRSVVAEEVDEEVVWKEAGTWEIYNFIKCDEDRADGTKLEVHSAETWALLQRTYADLVDEEDNSLPEGISVGLDGFYVPYKIDHGEFGRGVFAKEEISAGSLIWRSFNTAQFTDPEDFRAYLRLLPKPLACDVIHWAYTRFTEDDEVVVCVDLDPGSFTNACLEDEPCNMVIGEESKGDTGCNIEFYAGQDIPAGDEFKIDYQFSAHDVGWSILGLRRGYGQDEREAAMYLQTRAAKRAMEAELEEEEEEDDDDDDDDDDEEMEEDDDEEEEEEEEDDEDFEEWPTKKSVATDEL